MFIREYKRWRGIYLLVFFLLGMLERDFEGELMDWFVEV